MTRYYCTLFDTGYAPKGLALYQSLLRHSTEDFVLIVLAMDAECERILRRLKLPKMVVINLDDFERVLEMWKLRNKYTWQEYNWACASQLCTYILYLWNMSGITYLDADTFAFGDFKAVFDEIGERSVAITPHRFILQKQHLAINGIYNVGWTYFKHSAAGHEMLDWWGGQVRLWCHARIEWPNACGDQKYLDAFEEKIGSECCVIKNIGVNAGPWSIGNWKVTEGPQLDGQKLISYHFHSFRELDDGTLKLSDYELRDEDIEFIYKPYIAEYAKAKELIASVA